MKQKSLVIQTSKSEKGSNQKRSFSGFTLIELLAVIVILSIIALITTPIILNQIDQVKKNSFVVSAQNMIDAANIYVASNHTIPAEGMDIQNLEVKNKSSFTGRIYQNTDSELVLKDFSNGTYCASGTSQDLVVEKGTCGSGPSTPVVSITPSTITSKSIELEVSATDNTGIKGYAYCFENCTNEDNWKTTDQNKYTFDALTANQTYELYVRVMNKIDKVTEKTVEVTTKTLPTAAYSVSPSGWATNKTVQITYPNDVENYILIHSGSAKLNGTLLTLGERIKITEKSASIVFETIGSMEAITSDGFNEMSTSTLTISQVDATAPELVSVGIGTITSNSIQVIANGQDNESGIAKYEFQVNGGNWIDNGTNNTYLFSNLSSGTYTYKVRITNKTGLTTTSQEKTQATTTIGTPTYSVSPSGWTTSKIASITYQTGYTNQFRVTSGSAVYNGSGVTNNTWITITGTTASVKFNSNGTLEARSTDNVNTVTASTLTISQIDTTLPIARISASGGTDSITINASASTDSESGISNYLYSKDSMNWSTSSSNTYTFPGISAGSYTVFLKVIDRAGNVSSIVSATVTISGGNPGAAD